MAEFWESVSSFVAGHWSGILAVGAIVVSFYAAIISHLSMRASRRSASATESQAAAAETSAEAALTQAEQAFHQASIARDTSEVEALEAARSRIDQSAPSVVVTLSPMDQHPRIRRGFDQISLPHPETEPAVQQRLDYGECRHDDIYFVLRGMLYNDGDRVARVYAAGLGRGPAFHAGKHPTSGAELAVPQRSQVGSCHLLYPGQAALFEIHMTKQIDQILSQGRNGSDRSRFFSRDSFMFKPGSVDDPSLYVTITTEAEPLRERPEEPWDAPVIVRDHGHVDVLIERTIQYPKSFELLHAELQGDDEKLHRLQANERLWASIREAEKSRTEKM